MKEISLAHLQARGGGEETLRVQAKIFILPKIMGEISPSPTSPPSSKEGEEKEARDEVKERTKGTLSTEGATRS